MIPRPQRHHPRHHGGARFFTLALIATTTLGGVLSGLPTGNAGATPATAPGTPGNVVATAGQNDAFLMWTVPANNGASISAFVVKAYHGASLVGQGSVPVGAIGSQLDPTPGVTDSFNVPAQPGGVAVTFTVAATNSIGTSADSPHSVAVTPSTSPTSPAPPVAVKASSPASFQATVSWLVSPDNGSPITGFTVTALSQPSQAQVLSRTLPAGTTGSNLDPTPGAQDNLTISGLTPGQYIFIVGAVNAVGSSPSGSSPSTAVGGPLLSATQPLSPPFPTTTLGDASGPATLTLTNTGTVTDSVTNIVFGGTSPDDFFADTNCQNVAPAATCNVNVFFEPGALGTSTATMTISDLSPSTISVPLAGPANIGYYVFGLGGEVANFGDAGFYGDASNVNLNQPVVGMAPTGDDGGYWLVASDGGIFSFGDAQFYGSTGALHLNKPIVGMAATPDGAGYWLVASDGGIFAFGDAQFFGSTGSLHLNKPVVGMAVTPDGRGYWLVASDGGIFSFGDAQFWGSTGAIHLNQPIEQMAATPDGRGYWMVADDGGTFAFGDAEFFGSTGGTHLNAPIVGMTPMPNGSGYWLVDSDGNVFSFGGAPYEGSLGTLGVRADDVIGIATDGPPTIQAILDIPANRHLPSARTMHEPPPAPTATSGRWHHP